MLRINNVKKKKKKEKHTIDVWHSAFTGKKKMCLRSEHKQRDPNRIN